MQCSNDGECSPTSKLHIRAHGAHLDASLAMGGGQMERSPNGQGGVQKICPIRLSKPLINKLQFLFLFLF